MEKVNELFLQAVKAAMQGESVSWGEDVTADQYAQLLELAQNHHVLPMFFEATYRCPAAAAIEPARLRACRQTVVQSVSMQSVQTHSFLELNNFLRQQGIRPLVVKGIVCRSLYPQPDHRYSGDEDLLCPPQQLSDCHNALLEFGMNPCTDSLDAYEVAYRKQDGTLYIELHKSLFAGESDVFGGCNELFTGAFDRAAEVTVEGQKVLTLCPTDHLLYLILHAFKHFLHSGFGIRQVCDMVLFGNENGSNLDWDYLLGKCAAIRADKFAAALFTIGRKHLNFDPDRACYPENWRSIAVDEAPLLEDLLRGGIYGAADRNRLHSSNMTLNAVSASKKGKRSVGVIRAAFPSAKALENRYPYLKSKPFLLPVAWVNRFAGYAKENAAGNGTAQNAVKTGKDRINLLKTYDIID